MPERLWRATRAAPAGARPPLGQDQHNLPTSSPARSSRHPPRTCLRHGCGRTFVPQRWNQRYCSDQECRSQVRRWQAAKRQQRRRSRADVRQLRAAEAKRQRSQARAARASSPSLPRPPQEPRASGRAWSRRRKHSEPFCDRPGCYASCRNSRRSPARYCGEECRRAKRRVRDRERKWLCRKTSAGQYKRFLEYQARRAARAESCRQAISFPARPPGDAVGDYGESSDSSLSCRHPAEVPAHDSETPVGSRSRAPPAS